MKAKIYKTDIPIYFGKLWVIITKDFIKTGKDIGMDFDYSIGDCLAVAVTKSNKYAGCYLIMIKPNRINDTSVIAHEALHTSNAIFKSRGIYIDTTNDEAHAYFLGWIVTQVTNAIAKHKKRLKSCQSKKKKKSKLN